MSAISIERITDLNTKLVPRVEKANEYFLMLRDQKHPSRLLTDFSMECVYRGM